MAFGIDDAIAAGLKVLDKFIPDPEAKAKAETELRAALLGADKAQVAVNAAEAATGSGFIGGWRPFIGWVCGSALAYTYLAVPLGMWIADMAGIAMKPPPRLDGNLWELMMGMLGMGGLRTFEKIKGVAKT
jgi:hypothetical protein